MSSILLSLAQARRLAVGGQLLPAPPGTRLLDVVKHLGYLQLDPTNSIARSHLLVLFSRLGAFDEAELSRLRWDERRLYEYSAAIVPVDDLPIHENAMRRYPNAYSGEWPERVNTWLRDNDALRRSVLSQLRRRGPLASRELEDISERGWRSAGWTNQRNVSQMLNFLHAKGRVVIAGRQGQQRVWDLRERFLPPSDGRISLREAGRRVAERSLRALGVATAAEIEREYFVGGRFPIREALVDFEREGRIVRAEVEGLQGERFVHADSLRALDEKPRRSTTFLSPFDPLIRNRERTEALWNFRFRLEIYVPRAKREFGYFVLPILHGDELVGRIDPVYERKTGVLRVNNVFWEQGRREVSLERPLRSLATFVGAERVER